MCFPRYRPGSQGEMTLSGGTLQRGLRPPTGALVCQRCPPNPASSCPGHRAGHSPSFHTQLSLPLRGSSQCPSSHLAPCPWRPERGWLLLVTRPCLRSATGFCFLDASGSRCLAPRSTHSREVLTQTAGRTGPASVNWARLLVTQWSCLLLFVPCYLPPLGKSLQFSQGQGL